MRLASPDATSEILYSKLKTATAAIQIANDRAERAERDADDAKRACASKIKTITASLAASDVARRHAEEALRAASRPDPAAQARVRALEMHAHAARKTARECDDDAEREALLEEAEFHTCVARQARHCLETGTEPKAVAAHVFTCATEPRGDHEHVRGELVRLELSVALERALDAERTASGIAARHSAATAQQRTNSFVRAVSKDLQEGLQSEAAAYAAARQVQPAAVRR